MRIGLIGYPLGHSWSKEIHRFLIKEDYQMWELPEDALEDFLTRREFDGINVTIPYKQKVMAYLDELTPEAKAIGAVNCILNKNGRLIGYNTDYLGFERMLKKNGFDFNGKNVAVLGSGGASKAVQYAIKEMGGIPQVISRTKKVEGSISYEEMYEKEAEFSCLVNATPVGMYPKVEDSPVELQKFSKLESVVDIIANPLRTSLLFDGKMMGLKTLGGLEMLVAQALSADEIFTGRTMDDALIDACLTCLLKQRRNLVLIGMPSSGKSTLSALLGEKTGKEVIEMDQKIVETIGMSIAEYFRLYGEDEFRNRESEETLTLRFEAGKIISTGGGIIKRRENLRNLAYNGYIVWIDRPLEYLFASSDRPLSSDMDAVKKLYEERKGLYAADCDLHLANDTDLDSCLRILEDYV